MSHTTKIPVSLQWNLNEQMSVKRSQQPTSLVIARRFPYRVDDMGVIGPHFLFTLQWLLLLLSSLLLLLLLLCLIWVCLCMLGMHGAGLTHAMFLRSTSALIELFPSYWSTGEHFSAIASWRQLVYLRWINNDLTAERPDGRSTVVPPSVVTALVRNAVRRLCPLASPQPSLDDPTVPRAAAATEGPSPRISALSV